MDKKLLKAFKKQLKEKGERVLGLLKRIAKEDKNLEGDFDTVFPKIGRGVDENAAEVTIYDSTLPIEFRLEKDLQEIREAIDKIKKREYGICENCTRLIPIERLKAFPEAKLCLKCVKR